MEVDCILNLKYYFIMRDIEDSVFHDVEPVTPREDFISNLYRDSRQWNFYLHKWTRERNKYIMTHCTIYV